jgi:hypothetical protein
MHIYNIVVKDKKEKTIATETKVVFGIYIQPYNLVISIYIYIFMYFSLYLEDSTYWTMS